MRRSGAVLSHVGAFVTLAVVRTRGTEEAGRLAGGAVQVRLQGIGDVVPASCRVRALRVGARKVSVFRSVPGVMVVVEAGYVVLVAGSAAMTDRSRRWRAVVLAAHRVGL